MLEGAGQWAGEGMGGAVIAVVAARSIRRLICLGLLLALVGVLSVPAAGAASPGHEPGSMSVSQGSRPVVISPSTGPAQLWDVLGVGGEVPTVVLFCEVQGTGYFDAPVTLLPQQRTLEAVGSFDCEASIEGSDPVPLKGTLLIGRYTPPVTGLFGCLASEFVGQALVQFDEMLPGGVDTVLLEFQTLAVGPSFFHRGDPQSMGVIRGHRYLPRAPAVEPSEGFGEYLLQTDEPERCASTGFSELDFGGPAVLSINYIPPDDRRAHNSGQPSTTTRGAADDGDEGQVIDLRDSPLPATGPQTPVLPIGLALLITGLLMGRRRASASPP